MEKMWNLSTANIWLDTWLEYFGFPSPWSLLPKCRQSQESPACLRATDLVWTLHRCTRLSERVGDQRCQHQGCCKVRSQRCLMAPSIHLSPILIPLLSVFLLLFILFLPPSLPVMLVLCLLLCFSVRASSVLSMHAHYLFSQIFPLSHKFSPCFFLHSETLAWFNSVHFLEHFLWPVIAPLNTDWSLMMLWQLPLRRFSISITDQHFRRGSLAVCMLLWVVWLPSSEANAICWVGESDRKYSPPR